MCNALNADTLVSIQSSMNNLHVVLLAVVALAASRAALATEDITFVPVRFAPLVASPTLGVRPSDEPAAQVLHNEFLRVIHGQLKIGLVCEPSYYDISEKTELVYCTKRHIQGSERTQKLSPYS